MLAPTLAIDPRARPRGRGVQQARPGRGLLIGVPVAARLEPSLATIFLTGPESSDEHHFTTPFSFNLVQILARSGRSGPSERAETSRDNSP